MVRAESYFKRRLYCFTYSCSVCKSARVFASSNIQYALCVYVSLQVQPIRLILFTPPPSLCSISNIPSLTSRRIRGGERGPCPGDPAHTTEQREPPPPYWIHSLNMLNAAVDWTLRNYQNYLGHWQASPVVKRAMAVFGKTPSTGVCGREEGVYSSWVWVWCCSLNLLCFFFDKATLQIGNMKHFYWPQTRGSCHTRRRVWQRAQVVTHNR